jgi:hypothetical protein
LNCSKEKSLAVENLGIDTRALKEMGCRYILSAVPIKNFKALDVTYEKTFEDETAHWNIHLYRVL